ncbi:DUF4440 domain-containing protein [Nonomuraea sp. PA05]|uniref:nuclear transport factor 2 family protein n=1 Tax=Nonomuraea sp. PA05 TaxID=2604466 RepID=UPI0011D3D7E5|nr:nuclear transport factor 2 family protein [Nonomuraea sp. PA05]TYB61425.1 DUF4440 domain-containing protein [Nonomuraea sp. PA05]
MNTCTTKVAEEVLRTSLAGDTERLLELMAPDVVVEWPYRPDGVPGEVRGRRAFADFLAAYGGMITFHEYTDVELHQTLDPEVVIVEYAVRGAVNATGRSFEQRPVAVLRVRGGQVVTYRDYVNPLPVMEALRS